MNHEIWFSSGFVGSDAISIIVLVGWLDYWIVVGSVDGLDPRGFLDRSEVIRGVHVIPAFAHGHTSSPSTARQPTENDELLY